MPVAGILLVSSISYRIQIQYERHVSKSKNKPQNCYSRSTSVSLTFCGFMLLQKENKLWEKGRQTFGAHIQSNLYIKRGSLLITGHRAYPQTTIKHDVQDSQAKLFRQWSGTGRKA